MLSNHFRWEKWWEAKSEMVGKVKPGSSSIDIPEKRGWTEKKLSYLKLKTLGPGKHALGKGLYLDVQDSGSRSFLLRTTIKGKRSRNEIGLGGFPNVSLAEAEKEAAELRARAKRGEDILEQRRLQKRVTLTFEEAAIAVHQKLVVLDTYKDALGQFTPDRLRRLEKTLLTLIEQIEILKRTPLVCELRMRGRFQQRDLLRSLILPASGPFEGILSLRTVAHSVMGNPRKPKHADSDTYRELLYRTIHKHTNHWHDALVADMLNDALQPKHEITEGSLRNWRKEHGLGAKRRRH
jgi:hypothetical protein